MGKNNQVIVIQGEKLHTIPKVSKIYPLVMNINLLFENNIKNDTSPWLNEFYINKAIFLSEKSYIKREKEISVKTQQLVVPESYLLVRTFLQWRREMEISDKI